MKNRPLLLILLSILFIVWLPVTIKNFTKEKYVKCDPRELGEINIRKVETYNAFAVEVREILDAIYFVAPGVSYEGRHVYEINKALNVLVEEIERINNEK